MSFPAPPVRAAPSGGARRGYVLGPDEGRPGEACRWLGSLTFTKVRGRHPRRAGFRRPPGTGWLRPGEAAQLLTL